MTNTEKKIKDMIQAHTELDILVARKISLGKPDALYQVQNACAGDVLVSGENIWVVDEDGEGSHIVTVKEIVSETDRTSTFIGEVSEDQDVIAG